MFKVLKSGKRMKKSWKRMITKVTFVGPVSTFLLAQLASWCRSSVILAYVMLLPAGPSGLHA